MKKKIRLFALLLAAILLFSTVGCSKPAPLDYVRYPIPTHGQMPNRSDLDRLDYYFSDGSVPEIIVVEVTDDWILDPTYDSKGEIQKGQYIYYLPCKVKQTVLDSGVKKNQKILAHFGGSEIFFSQSMCPAYAKGHQYILFGTTNYVEGPEGNTQPTFSCIPYLVAYWKTDGTIQPLTDCKALNAFDGMTLDEFRTAITEYFA